MIAGDLIKKIRDVANWKAAINGDTPSMFSFRKVNFGSIS